MATSYLQVLTSPAAVMIYVVAAYVLMTSISALRAGRRGHPPHDDQAPRER